MKFDNRWIVVVTFGLLFATVSVVVAAADWMDVPVETVARALGRILAVTVLATAIAWILRHTLDRWTLMALLLIWLAIVLFSAWPVFVESLSPLPSFIEPDDARHPWYMRQWFRWTTSIALVGGSVLAWRKRLQ